MIAELEGYQDQLLSIRQDAEGLLSSLSRGQFNWRPIPNRWSMAENFGHLNASASRVFKPGIDGAIAIAERNGLKSQGPFVYPPLERLFLRLSEPPPRVRFRAPRVVTPAPDQALDLVRGEFLDWQNWLADRLGRADGLDLRRARHRAPTGPLRWSLGTYFAVMLAHERRHIWQARQVRNDSGFPNT